ncbi:MAG: cytochrome c5 family protein [Arenicellales bacterium]|nr:cytochrome c5 family protein [Arenicellales bacterium]
MSEHMSDAAFGKVFAGMIAGMVALTIILIIIAYAVGGEAGSQRSDIQMGASDQETSARTTPVASVAVGEVAETPAVTEGPVSGESVYQASCLACHAAGVAGAPKIGDTAAWEPRIAQGIEVLYDHAINGFNTMPPKGGNMSLSDDAVKAAVDFMLGQESGG